VAAVTALLHFWLARKTVVPQFQVVLVAAILLLGFRVWWATRSRSQPRPADGRQNVNRRVPSA
jgi:DMSO/TMAO reductase YedYZ heme-binding membrane subunit